MIPIEPGLYYNISFRDYQQIDALNINKLKGMLRSPLHFKTHEGESSKDSKDKQLGRLVHCLYLTPNEFDAQFIQEPEGLNLRTKADRETMSAFKQAHEGLDIIDGEDLWIARAIVANLPPLPSDAETEVTEIFLDPWYGIKCKRRYDLIWERTSKWDFKRALDLKTCISASIPAITRDVTKWRYDLQGAFYQLNRPLLDFQFLCAEKTSPYASQRVNLPVIWHLVATNTIQGLLGEYKTCLEANKWPGYPQGVTTLTMPEYLKDTCLDEGASDVLEDS